MPWSRGTGHRCPPVPSFHRHWLPVMSHRAGHPVGLSKYDIIPLLQDIDGRDKEK